MNEIDSKVRKSTDDVEITKREVLGTLDQLKAKMQDFVTQSEKENKRQAEELVIKLLDLRD